MIDCMPFVRLHVTVNNFCVKLTNSLKILTSVSVILKIIRFMLFMTEHDDLLFKNSKFIGRTM